MWSVYNKYSACSLLLRTNIYTRGTPGPARRAGEARRDGRRRGEPGAAPATGGPEREPKRNFKQSSHHLSPGLDNSTGNSTGTRQATRQLLDRIALDSSTATRQTSIDLDRNPPDSMCRRRQVSSSTARQLDRHRQTSRQALTRSLRRGKAGLEPHSFKVKVDGPTGQLHNLVAPPARWPYGSC